MNKSTSTTTTATTKPQTATSTNGCERRWWWRGCWRRNVEIEEREGKEERRRIETRWRMGSTHRLTCHHSTMFRGLLFVVFVLCLCCCLLFVLFVFVFVLCLYLSLCCCLFVLFVVVVFVLLCLYWCLRLIWNVEWNLIGSGEVNESDWSRRYSVQIEIQS